jgi:putative DNA primase/helicase
VRGCGKSTALSLVSALAFKARKFDHTTPAVLFRLIDREHPCILLDEADNQDLPGTAALRTVINSGHRTDGTFTRCLAGEEKVFSTFAPLGLAAIGELPLPILHRSIVLRMERAPNARLARFDPKTIPRQKADCKTIYVKRSNGRDSVSRL